MQALNSQFDIEDFFARVRTAPARLLMLDYDGTLAPFHMDPAQAVPYPGVTPLLDAIMDAGRTRLVIVSGRWTKDLIPLLGLKRLPELWGSHGWERLHTNGEYVTPRIRPRAVELLVAADDWIAELETLGARTERKPASVAFHWRGLPNAQIAEIRNKLFEKWMELARADELAWHDFDGGIELRIAGQDKGDVVRTVAAETAPDAVLAYLGDDLTDEDAFKAMPEHGAAILVRPQFRPTAADLWIRPPEELLEFLTRWHEAAGAER
jgi:trehalose 6-phosphate phosphatase